MVSKRLQSALYAGAEALIQTANAPVSHHSLRMGRGRDGEIERGKEKNIGTAAKCDSGSHFSRSLCGLKL
ncbi:unnamed protein product [Leuciscus chuanchicus]